MAKKLPAVDVVLVGFGWTGAILGQELTDAGLKVLALERGGWRDTSTDFAVTFAQDELRYMWRHALFEEPVRETLTFRNSVSETALPMRHLGSFLPATGVGGAGIHWNGQTWRFLPSDFVARSHNTQRYGALPNDMTVQDWGVTYDELEPYYDKFEYLCGVSGKAGNLERPDPARRQSLRRARARATIPTPRSTWSTGRLCSRRPPKKPATSHFPVRPPTCRGLTPIRSACSSLPAPIAASARNSAAAIIRNRARRRPSCRCLLRKDNFELRTECEVMRIEHDAAAKRATGVIYVDTQGEEYEQPAEMVIMCAYALHNPRLLLLSGIGQPYDPKTGQGVIGKNYAYQIVSGVDVFFDDKILNPFVGAGALGIGIDEYNGDNFDHSGLGFIGGGYLACWNTNGRPIEHHPTPKDTPKWGAAWKKAIAKNYLTTATISTHGAVMSHRNNYLDLDPTYRDVYGRPLMRMTFDYTDNEHKMSDYLTDRAADIAKAMKPREINAKKRTGHYDIVPYQTTHNTGGAIMGADPKSSAVNRYLQSWDLHNLFVMGACAFPQNAGYNPTGTLAALAYWSAEAIKTKYLKNPGPLVQA